MDLRPVLASILLLLSILCSISSADAQPVRQPIVLQAELTGGQWTPFEDGRSEDRFGHAIAQTGEFLLVSAVEDVVRSREGSVYVYRQQQGQWVLQDKLLQVLYPDEVRNSRFGRELAASGDTLVVSAGEYTDFDVHVFMLTEEGRWVSQGRVFGPFGTTGYGGRIALDGNTLAVTASYVVLIFEREAGQWSLTQVLEPVGDEASTSPAAVAVSGDSVFVGAIGTGAGTVSVYERQEGAWARTALLQSSDQIATDRFGAQLAVQDDILLVAAPGPTTTSIGSVYLFERNHGLWAEVSRIDPPDGAPGDGFGSSLVLAQDRFVVGAPGHDDGAAGAGAAYVYARQASEWVLQRKLQASSPVPHERLASAVEIAGEQILLGAPSSSARTYQQGLVRAFAPDGEDWRDAGAIDSGAGLPTTRFGTTVDVSGDLAIVGGWGGEVHVFRKQAEAGWRPESVIYSEDALPLRGGIAVADDSLLIGDRNHGAVNSYVSTSEGWQLQQRLEPGERLATAQFGTNVATAGNWAVVSAPLADVGENSRQGLVVVYRWDGSHWERFAELTGSNSAHDRFGSAVAISGETIVVGAPYFDSATLDSHGAVHVFNFLDGSWVEVARLHAPDPVEDNSFGSAVALHDDHLLVGAPSPRVQLTGRPRPPGAHLFVHRDGEWRHAQAIQLPWFSDPSFFGSEVALSSEVALIAARSPGQFHGTVLVYGRRGETWRLLDVLNSGRSKSNDGFGESLALQGDELIVGAPTLNSPLPFSNSPEGRALVFSGLAADAASRNHSQVYWNAAQPGWGLNLAHQGDQVFGTWYTYADDGLVQFLTIQATRGDDQIFRGPIYRVSGIPFSLINGSQAFVSATEIGEADLYFDNDGTVVLVHEMGGLRQSAHLEPLVFDDAVPQCVGTDESRESLTNYSDLWWNRREAGWGLTVAHQGNVIFLLWYTYDDAGRDQWISASRLERQSDGSFEGQLQRPLTGVPLHQIEAAATDFPVPTVGTARLHFESGTTGRFEYTVNGLSGSKLIERFEFVGAEFDKPACY